MICPKGPGIDLKGQSTGVSDISFSKRWGYLQAFPKLNPFCISNSLWNLGVNPTNYSWSILPIDLYWIHGESSFKPSPAFRLGQWGAWTWTWTDGEQHGYDEDSQATALVTSHLTYHVTIMSSQTWTLACWKQTRPENFCELKNWDQWTT